MPTEKTILLYRFEELSDEAKETARDWWRSCREPSDLDSTVEDFATICEALGITLKQRSYQTMGGATRYEPDVQWSLGYTQGDYAGFDGTYRHTKGATRAIKAYAPKDTELHRIAVELSKAQRLGGFKLRADITYHHYYGQQVEVEHEDRRDVSDAAYSAIKEAIRDLCHWLYKALQEEDEYQSSAEYVDEAIEANEYTFTESGKRED